jgi:hypothetical protein
MINRRYRNLAIFGLPATGLVVPMGISGCRELGCSRLAGCALPYPPKQGRRVNASVARGLFHPRLEGQSVEHVPHRVVIFARHDTESFRAPVEERAACIQLSGGVRLRFRCFYFTRKRF